MKATLSALFLAAAAAAAAEVVTLPHPAEPLPPGRTVVWSPLFQASWDALNAKLGGPPTKVEPPNPLMAKLDTFKWDAAQVMPEGSWKTWCDTATPDFLQQVNREAAALTKEPTGPFTLPEAPGENTIAFYGLLDRQVEFRKPFFRSRKVPLTFRVGESVTPVQFFGVKGPWIADFADSVSVLAYRPVDHSHALQIRCKNGDDTVIFYLPPKPQDFATACHWLRIWREEFKTEPNHPDHWDDRQLHAGDSVCVPYLTLAAKADFLEQLPGARYHEKQPVPWEIVRAEQVTRFNLHERGAEVRVEVSGGADPFGGPPPPPWPRAFVYDRPFFVFLWRDGAEWPYFGAWIGDATALKAFP